MKKHRKYIVLFLLLGTLIYANNDPNTDSCIVASVTSYSYEAGGKHLPSIGEINVLLIFAEFKDDNYSVTNSRWEKDHAPQNMNNWIDQVWSTNPTEGSLTHYFNEMSKNKLKLTGKEIHIVTNKTRAEYKTLGWQRGEINKELIQRIDVTENFANFDNWTKNSDYSHSNISDNKVDMIIMVWRNIDNDVSINYKSDFDFHYNYADLGRIGTFYVDGGLRYISTNNWGSGVTINGYLDIDPFRTVVHEFTHFLLGGNDMHNGYGYWGMLSDWGSKSYNINAFELYQLQWAVLGSYYTIDLTDPTVQTLTKNLYDFLKYNRAIRLKVGTNKYFYIENHQKKSYWESHTPFSSNPNSIDGTIENGIYIIRQEGLLGSGRRCIPADGRNDWEVVQAYNSPYDSKILPLWQNFSKNRLTGHHTLEKIYHNYPGCTESTSNIHFVKNPSTGVVEEPMYFMGTGTHAFRMGYNEIFSPWSNPNNQKSDNSTVNFSMQLNSINNGVASIKIYKNNPQASPPSKPENLNVIWYNNHPKLTWDSNIEPDMKDYKIWKHVDGSSMIVATLTHNSSDSIHSWTDSDVTKAGKFDPLYTYSYKVKAIDSLNNESLYSNQVSINGTGGIWKIHEEDKTETVISMYSLTQNYPNPFNPTTQISYQIPKDGFVNLTVYNSLGQEVAKLVNQHQLNGSYLVEFNASNLPSGIYIYKLQTNEFSSTKKMILAK